jgi:antitoxin (DNA-binding transcriptional repressor) of toxin-antitoxin stability system
MKTVTIHQAKTHLSQLVEQAAQGEAFIIAKGRKQMVKVVPLTDTPVQAVPRIGFLAGNNFQVPDDFDSMAQDDIEALFYGKP